MLLSGLSSLRSGTKESVLTRDSARQAGIPPKRMGLRGHAWGSVLGLEGPDGAEGFAMV